MIAFINAIPSLLNYGLLGLAALIVFLFWRVISAEQRRDGQPRKGIVRMSWAFITLSVLLAAAATCIELSGAPFAKAENIGLKTSNQALEDLSQDLKQKLARLEERERSQEELIERLDNQIKQLSEVFNRLKSSYANAKIHARVNHDTVGTPQTAGSQRTTVERIESELSTILEGAEMNIRRSHELRSPMLK